ncbi:hypothetical protein OIU79_030328 [Salix purpurea]|uniref:Uncharacterized protein n=1 Tax=Salix purpurea TaxID=77065 RepID=A0A9Q0VAD8_SALPP|nr:hypothetical protein OIU79_030328 [Salix purpurea]
MLDQRLFLLATCLFKLSVLMWKISLKRLEKLLMSALP